jgi:hypothetical protein
MSEQNETPPTEPSSKPVESDPSKPASAEPSESPGGKGWDMEDSPFDEPLLEVKFRLPGGPEPRPLSEYLRDRTLESDDKPDPPQSSAPNEGEGE